MTQFEKSAHKCFFPLPPFLLWKGATIKKDEQTGAIIVARIMRGGAADRSGESLFIHWIPTNCVVFCE